MIPLRLSEIAGIVGGQVADAAGDPLVTGPVGIDHRTVAAGGMFAAFAGAHVDGHDFAGAALDAGAVAVLGSRATGHPSVLVPDVRLALQRLAGEVLARLRRAGDPRVTAITGSQGKTSTKDMLGRVLARAAPTVATEGSFNNELGLPLTVLRSTPGTRHLVLEMGARGIGHLTELCAIAPPDVSLVLNVGKAHLGEFGSVANIALAKGELVEALPADGVAVLNADDPLVSAMAGRTRARVLTFGRAPGADVRFGEVSTDELGRPAFRVAAGSTDRRVRLALLGSHHVANAAAVLACVLALGADVGRAIDGLESITRLSRWRMELHERPDGLAVINDAYNANPDSMRAALQTLASLGEGSARRTVAVLGEMRELGEASEAEHRAVGEATVDLGIDEVLVVGEGAHGIAEGRAGRGGTTRQMEGVAEASAWLRKNVAGAALVLVKASRAAELEHVVSELLEVEG